MVPLVSCINLTALFTLAVTCFLPSTVHAQTTIGIGAGQTLTEADLISGSFQGSEFELGLTTSFDINEGGIIDRVGETDFPFTAFDFNGSTINVNAGGTFGDAAGSPPISVAHVTINLHDEGTIRRSIRPDASAVVNVYGGFIDSGYRALPGSTTNVHGGVFDDFVELRGGSVANFAGGQLRFSPNAFSGSEVTFIGGEFKLNGEPLPMTSQLLDARAGVFSGTFLTGEQFIVFPDRFDEDANISLNVVDLPPLDANPIVVDSEHGFDGTGLRTGQSLSLRDGGALGRRFTVDGATLSIEGGEVGEHLDIIDSEVSISGGLVSSNMEAYIGSTIDIFGGTVQSNFNARNGSIVNIRGGSVGNSFEAHPGSIVNIFGGEIGPTFIARSRSVVNINGGHISELLGADWESTVNLLVQQISLDGVPIQLSSGETIEIDAGTHDLLEAILADGAPIQLELNRHPKDSLGVSPFAILTATRVPEPASWLLLVGQLLSMCLMRKNNRGQK